MRIRGIDLFRGLSIVLMVFFSLTIRLSDKLPDFLLHNAEQSLHAGDFVLPMFLFASGMSLVFYAKKRKKLKRTEYFLDIAERFGKLVLISIFITPFSVGQIGGMDEVMMSVVLFVPTLFLTGYSDRVLAAISIGIMALYLILGGMSMLPDFSLYYLGGYQAAVFYLPVMLAGAITARNINRMERLILPSLLVAIPLLAIIPPYKMVASPSFMALSIFFSLAAYYLIRNVRIEQLEYIGKRPLYYWVLKWVVLTIPLTFYAIFSGYEKFPLSFGALEAAVMAMAGMIILYFVQVGLDYIVKRSRMAARPM
ncbi:DUF1624 domain-containing protein [Candidatus Micrarchaeota archaeon]|nr:DUF1624 domain-containing protein [Candidatus Micrarchaeota archaeon]